MILKSLDTFIEIAKQRGKKSIAVAAAEDEPVLSAVAEAKKHNIAEPILVGNIEKIKSISSALGFDLTGIQMINELDPAKSSRVAAQLVKEGSAQILMKGLVSTADYLRAVLDKEAGLRKGDLLSHIGFFEFERYHKLLALTDAAQNIAPSFDEKVSIMKNSIDLFHRLGVDKPKIGLVAAVETVTSKMETTLHWASLTMMNKRGQLKGCIIDGPLAFDNIISKEAAVHKGIESEVSGDADLIMCSNIEVANALYKSFTYAAGATVAAVVLGAKVPIILTSRADSDRSKLTSIALAASY
jgi:phosphate butyryltransferase